MTQAGISEIAGSKAVRTGQAEAGIAKIFDANQVEQDIQAQVQITQTFTQRAPRAIADYAGEQAKELRKHAEKETD